MIKVVFDTQIILRATINRRSRPARLFFDLRESYQQVISPAILAEVEDVLHRPSLKNKFKTLTDESIEATFILLSSAEIVVPDDVPSISRDPKDDMFLACAVASGADYIVSEDKDLLVLNPFEGVRIVNARDFLRILKGA